MNPASIREILTQLWQHELRAQAPLPEGNLAEVLDSMQRLQFVVAIEDRFQICLDPEEDAQVESLDDIVRIIADKLAQAPHA